MNEHEDAVYTIARILLWVCTTLAILFPLLYHWKSEGSWRRTPVGRYVMSFRVIFALLLLGTALGRWIPLITLLYISMVLYALSAVVLVMQIKFLYDPDSMDPQNALDPQRLLSGDEKPTGR